MKKFIRRNKEALKISAILLPIVLLGIFLGMLSDGMDVKSALIDLAKSAGYISLITIFIMFLVTYFPMIEDWEYEEYKNSRKGKLEDLIDDL